MKELNDVIRACMEENDLHFSQPQIDILTTALFEDADTERRGAITCEALKNQLEKHDGFLENLSIRLAGARTWCKKALLLTPWRT